MSSQQPFTPDGALVLTASDERVANLWNIDSGDCVRTFDDHSGLVFSAAISPDGTHILTGSIDRTAKLWSMESGQCLLTFAGHSDYVCSAAFSPDVALPFG
mmetsp:Transcript_60586/g.119257  ORF Transcript_60586/g.119257 Transcript_60586/m.119257 type:complete len:101 (+) Transcript_60586:1-303(+)